jgi:hypothetical protein
MAAMGGRRYVLVLLVGAASTVLQACGKMDPAGANYMLLMVGTVGAYIAGNTAQKIQQPQRDSRVVP